MVKKTVFILIILMLLVTAIYISLSHSNRVNFSVADVESAELTVNGDFDVTEVSNEQDIQLLISSINESNAAFPEIGMSKGGYTLYSIIFHFKDGGIEEYSFVVYSRDGEKKTSKFARVSQGAGYMTGTVEYVFYDLILKHNPTERNMEWYNYIVE